MSHLIKATTFVFNTIIMFKKENDSNIYDVNKSVNASIRKFYFNNSEKKKNFIIFLR